jgi:hypothetical protein
MGKTPVNFIVKVNFGLTLGWALHQKPAWLTWWYISIIPELMRQRQKDQEFRAILGYMN